jgi:hypothetical protein
LSKLQQVSALYGGGLVWGLRSVMHATAIMAT